MPLLPANTPEQIEAALLTVRGRYALGGPHKRLHTVIAMLTGVIICVALTLGAWQSHWNPVLLVLAIATPFFAAYDLIKLYRVVEIGPDFVEYRVPLRFLSWRIQVSELRGIDMELGQKEDSLRLVTKTSGKRRLPIPTAVGARLRA